MYVTTINEKEFKNLKENREKYMGVLGAWKGEEK